jgi:redox-sensitive bicupin YhaK (pirin superfamily)
MIRRIHSIHTTDNGPFDPRALETRDLMAHKIGPDMDPFIVTSLFRMRGPVFPPHPHAGFSVATYILPESTIGFVNQDSSGLVNRIDPGSLHWTTAGSGTVHEETVTRRGSVALGFQIWIDLGPDKRLIPPAALHTTGTEVPVWHGNGVTARAVLGKTQDVAGTLPVPTPVRLIDLTFAPDATFAQALEARENAFVFVVDGQLSAGDGTATAAQVIRTQPGAQAEDLILTAGPEGARAVLFAGQPIGAPYVAGGPFIADDEAQLQHFMADYRAGRMGRVAPFNQATIDQAA